MVVLKRDLFNGELKISASTGATREFALTSCMELNSHSCIQSGKMKICANGVTLEKSDTSSSRTMRDDAQLGITQSERHDYENTKLFSSLPTVFEGRMSVKEPKPSSREQLSNIGEYLEYTQFVM